MWQTRPPTHRSKNRWGKMEKETKTSVNRKGCRTNSPSTSPKSVGVGASRLVGVRKGWLQVLPSPAKNLTLAKGKAHTEHCALSVQFELSGPRKRVQALYLSDPWEGREKAELIVRLPFGKIMVNHFGESCVTHQVVYGKESSTWELVLMTQAVPYHRHT